MRPLRRHKTCAGKSGICSTGGELISIYAKCKHVKSRKCNFHKAVHSIKLSARRAFAGRQPEIRATLHAAKAYPDLHFAVPDTFSLTSSDTIDRLFLMPVRRLIPNGVMVFKLYLPQPPRHEPVLVLFDVLRNAQKTKKKNRAVF